MTKRVIVHIDRLVLRGHHPHDRIALAESLRGEIESLLARPSTVGALVSLGDRPRLDAGAVRVVRAAKPRRIGAAIARAVVRSATR